MNKEKSIENYEFKDEDLGICYKVLLKNDCFLYDRFFKKIDFAVKKIYEF